MKLTIIGAGVTGLFAAIEAAQRGHEVTVHEAAAAAGGLAAGFRSGRFVFDMGPHALSGEIEDVTHRLEDLLGDELLHRKKVASQYHRGRVVGFPPTMRELAGLFNLLQLPRIACEGLVAVMRRPTHPDSFADWVRSRFGKTLGSEYFEPLAEKVWGLPPDELDPQVASHRLDFDSSLEVVKRLLGIGRRRLAFHNPLQVDYRYPVGGTRRLVETLVGRAEDLGVGIRLSSGLEEMDIKESRVERMKFSCGTTVDDSDHVISTIPVTRLGGVAGWPVPELRWRSMVLVFVESDRDLKAPWHWLYLPEPRFRFQRVTNFARLEAGMCPQGAAALAFEVSCFQDDPTWSLDDAEITARVLDEFDGIERLDRSGLRTNVVRIRHAYPVLDVGFAGRLEPLMERVASVRNLSSTGRQGAFSYSNMHLCMEMGLKTVDSLG